MCIGGLKNMFSNRSERLQALKAAQDAADQQAAIANAREGEQAARARDNKLRRLNALRGPSSFIFGSGDRGSIARADLIGQP